MYNLSELYDLYGQNYRNELWNVIGQTAIRLIDMALLNEAIWLLKATDYSITQIADQLNYSSPAANAKILFWRNKQNRY